MFELTQNMACVMDTRISLGVLAVLLVMGGPGWAETEQKPIKDPGAEYRRIFSEEMDPTERTRALERLVKEHSDSPWADDALWVLGEAARQQGSTRRTVYFWHYLMARRPDVRLEEFTRGLEVYRKAPIPRVMLLMEVSGVAYAADGSEFKDGDSFFYNAKPFNAVPMLVWEELGRSYKRLQKPALAVKAYRKALESAPPQGRWADIYGRRVERLEKIVALGRPENPGGKASESAAASGHESVTAGKQSD